MIDDNEISSEEYLSILLELEKQQLDIIEEIEKSSWIVRMWRKINGEYGLAQVLSKYYWESIQMEKIELNKNRNSNV